MNLFYRGEKVIMVKRKPQSSSSHPVPKKTRIGSRKSTRFAPEVNQNTENSQEVPQNFTPLQETLPTTSTTGVTTRSSRRTTASSTLPVSGPRSDSVQISSVSDPINLDSSGEPNNLVAGGGPNNPVASGGGDNCNLISSQNLNEPIPIITEPNDSAFEAANSQQTAPQHRERFETDYVNNIQDNSDVDV